MIKVNNPFAYHLVLRPPYRGCTSSDARTYILGSKDVYPRIGGHKTKPVTKIIRDESKVKYLEDYLKIIKSGTSISIYLTIRFNDKYFTQQNFLIRLIYS
ncbi:hypothetical protein B5F78_02155 [Bacteroides sp. An279]|nr:hypothetical protein B5F78_02155 [Bacteroides sp. An279]